jgi:hypothetical protein
MRNPSPKARQFIQAGIEQLDRREDAEAWRHWSDDNPFQRTPGSVNQAQARMPDALARTVLQGLDALSRRITAQIDGDALDREAKIALENDLGYIEDIKAEIHQDLRERV